MVPDIQIKSVKMTRQKFQFSRNFHISRFLRDSKLESKTQRILKRNSKKIGRSLNPAQWYPFLSLNSVSVPFLVIGPKMNSQRLSQTEKPLYGVYERVYTKLQGEISINFSKLYQFGD